MNISMRARDLLADIARRGGGEIPEFRLLVALDCSHGTFVAARRELVAAALLRVTHPCRHARYEVLAGAEELAAMQRRSA